MFNLDIFIADSVTFRPVSMFATDIEANKNSLAELVHDVRSTNHQSSSR